MMSKIKQLAGMYEKDKEEVVTKKEKKEKKDEDEEVEDATAALVKLSLTPEEEEKAEEIHLNLSSARLNADSEDVLVHVNITPGSGVTRSPVDVVCVVDISGSMSTEASLKTGTGSESHGLSLLDIVKHAVKTVVKSLAPTDQFALVVFSDTARVVTELSPMVVEGVSQKSKFCKTIDGLCTEGSTNLWDGLLKGLEVLGNSKPGRVSTVFILTDGLPNKIPPGGELATFKKFKENNPDCNATVNTFGFGYSIDTPLLLSLAVEGRGMHSFIPDASFVGTAFVNCITNILSTVGTNMVLSLEQQGEAKVVNVLGNYQTQLTLTSWGAQLSMCSLQYGQSQDVVVQLSVPKSTPSDTNFFTATVKFDHVQQAKKVEIESSISPSSISPAIQDQVNLQVHQLRLDFVSTVAFVIELMKNNDQAKAEAALADIEERVRQCDDARAKALLQDISGQCKEAIKTSPENYYHKWGRHYLPSLARAHLLQQCNNFKDPGIQVYGGQLFQKIRDVMDEIFLKLPPPQPSVKRSYARSSYSSSSSSSSSSYSAPRDMSAYYNSAGPCFAGECKVLMASGEMKNVENIQKGDMVDSINGAAEVLCVIRTLCMKEGKRGIEDLVILPGGLKVTPYHPVRIEGEWIFPADIKEKELKINSPCDSVFNFVLKQGHVMKIEGIECVTLGHNFTGSTVIEHAYYGTERVVEDLKKMKGWESGKVVLNPEKYNDGKCMKRDKDGLVCGFATSIARDV